MYLIAVTDPEDDWGWATFDKEEPFINYFRKYSNLDENELKYWENIIISFCDYGESGDVLPFPNGLVAKVTQEITAESLVFEEDFDICGSCGMDFLEGESVYIGRSGRNTHQVCWHWDMRFVKKNTEYYDKELKKIKKIIWGQNINET